MNNFYRPILLGLVLCATLLLAAMTTKLLLSVSYASLFRDVGAIQNLPVSEGLFSQIGIVVWVIGIGGLLQAALSLPKLAHPTSAFILYSLFLTSILMADDAFRIHETVFDQLFGVGERIAFLGYFLLIAGYLMIFCWQILYSNFILLGIALLLFALSMCIDQTPGLANYIGNDMVFFLEDGAKLAGIVFWTLYQMLIGRICLQSDTYAVPMEKGFCHDCYEGNTIPGKTRRPFKAVWS